MEDEHRVDHYCGIKFKAFWKTRTSEYPAPKSAAAKAMTREDVARKAGTALDSIEKVFTASTLETLKDAIGTIDAATSTDAATDSWRPRLDEIMQDIVGLLGDVSQFFPATQTILEAFKTAVNLVVVGLKNERQIDVIKMTILHLITVILDIAKDTTIKDDEVTPLTQAFTDVALRIAQSTAVCRAFKSTCRMYRFLGAEYWARKLEEQIAALKAARAEFHDALTRDIHRLVERIAHDVLDKKQEVFTVKLIADLKLSLSPPATDEKRSDAPQQPWTELYKLWKRDNSLGDSKWDFGSADEFKATVDEEMKKAEESNNAKITQFIAESKASIEDLVKKLGDKVDKAADRVVDVVQGDAYKLIHDTDVRTVWRQMLWPVSVEANKFVVAMKDYFTLPRQERSNADQSTFEDGEIWATQYISISRTRPLIEAIDQDSSGWISVSEINTFTAMRARNVATDSWHLTRLFAFWAAGKYQYLVSTALFKDAFVGFPSACWSYARKISAIRAHMVSLAPVVLPVNRTAVDVYLDFSALSFVDCISHATLRTSDPFLETVALPHFGDYINDEEVRLRNELDRLEWKIDDSVSISRITADGGPIERFILPLLFLLLKRHLAIIHHACNYPIDGWELWEAIDTITILLQEFYRRKSDLSATLRNQNRDPETEFQLTCNGIFSLWTRRVAELSKIEFDAHFNEKDPNIAPDRAFRRSWLRYPNAGEDDADGPTTGLWKCDACGDRIKGSRIWCLQCRQPDGDTIDVCGDRPLCATACGRGVGTLHVPQHDVLKIYRFLHDRDRGRILAMAKLKLDTNARLFEVPVLPSDQLVNAKSTNAVLTVPYSTGRDGSMCIKCGISIRSPPCWLCVECDDIALLCDVCDQLQPSFIQELHKARTSRLSGPFDPDNASSFAIVDDPNSMQADFYAHQPNGASKHRWWHVLVRLSFKGPVPNDSLTAKLAMAEAEIASKQAELERMREELERSKHDLALADAKLAMSEVTMQEEEL